MALSDYDVSIGNWRQQLQKNERKSRLVILLFLAIYLSIGILLDSLVLHSHYPQIPVQYCLQALISFKVIPYATLIITTIAVIAVLITYAYYDRIMLLGTQSREITTENAKTLQEKQLVNVVEEMKVAAGLRYLPKIFLIKANYMNAFASGYSEKSAMVAITRGLLEKLDRAELQAVMAHELSHIRHHDIKLILMVAVLSNILLIIVDMLFYSVVTKRDKRRDNGLVLIIMILRYGLPLITSLLTLFLSRTREYMADSGAVELMRNNEPMARALMKISTDHEQNAAHYNVEYGHTAHEHLRRAAYLFDPTSVAAIVPFNTIFSTHPTLSQRLDALGFKRKN